MLKGFEVDLKKSLSRQIEEAGLPVKYETDKLSYIWPQREAKYTPDFLLAKKDGFFYIRSKGVFDVESRQKHLLIAEQHPDIDLRFVFSNVNQKIYKGSPTTYGMWCEKHGFAYANRKIPQEWLDEAKEQSEQRRIN